MINSQLAMKKQKQKNAQTEDSIEALKGISGSIKKAAVQEGRNIIHDMWKQALRPSSMSQAEAKEPQKQPQKAGDLKPGEELSLKEEKKQLHIEPGIDYVREIVHAERKIQAEESHEIKMRMQEIIIEIKKLTKSSKELEVEFKDVQQIERIPQNAGKYHANFVEWLLSMVRGARERVDNAISWTSAIKGKKQQRQYWSLFKKHGTSFGLSGERVVATQVG